MGGRGAGRGEPPRPARSPPPPPLPARPAGPRAGLSPQRRAPVISTGVCRSGSQYLVPPRRGLAGAGVSLFTGTKSHRLAEAGPRLEPKKGISQADSLIIGVGAPGAVNTPTWRAFSPARGIM